ncbi:hypothetical protein ACDA63_07410 [Uliginosibacterium sp. sgz301328]|uniref:hypothetical protein n=1 Tax=Uliginosibacterium sp. sgz301328 TaxID=3243764 RepID=UPI00359D967F
MRLKKITYLIDWHDNCRTEKSVTGYAVDSTTGVRYCVRQDEDGAWVVDHYDTGRSIGALSIGRMYALTRRQCIDAAERFLTQAVSDGRYARAIEAYNRSAA